MNKSDAGRMGGTMTLERYGRDQLTEWGKRGGRPRSQTYNDIRQRELRERNNNKEGKGFPGTSNLNTLKELYKARDRSSPNNKKRQRLSFREIPEDGPYQNLLARVFPGQLRCQTLPAGIANENPTEAVPAIKESGIEVTPP